MYTLPSGLMSISYFQFVLGMHHVTHLLTSVLPRDTPQVDATVESDLGQKFGVQGYPTLKWFVDGELASDYSGPRDR